MLLRGVNVGPHHRIRMPDLRALLGELGCSDVETHLQSGSAAVTWSGTSGELETAVHAGLQATLGWTVPVLVRTGEELARVVAGTPWTGPDPKLFHVAFLSAEPDPARVAAIDHTGLLPERVVVGERVLYCDHALGVQRSRLARLDLGVAVTARNWRTTQALADLTA